MSTPSTIILSETDLLPDSKYLPALKVGDTLDLLVSLRVEAIQRAPSRDQAYAYVVSIADCDFKRLLGTKPDDDQLANLADAHFQLLAKPFDSLKTAR